MFNRKSPFWRFIVIENYIGTAVLLITIALWIYGRFRPQPKPDSSDLNSVSDFH